ncbi:MAG TPA: class I SAM-dependent methyltransferase [Caulobacteraceae bacterium]|nr:class I SAM-dependent methyltransferase [Caulobacteraceae bacterium]
MDRDDSVFTGSIPDLYDRYLGPILFEPFALDMAARFAGFGGAILETAAGTGRLTRALAAAAPQAALAATDLNQPMLDRAAALVTAPGVRWRQADAQALPFEDRSFDAVVCQFGVMFLPDKLAGFSEARRVLRPGGRFVFSVWGDLAENELSVALQEALARLFPDDIPQFLPRSPFGYHDEDEIGGVLAAAGFGAVDTETVTRVAAAESVGHFAVGQCMGSPLRAEIEARLPGGLDRTVEEVTPSWPGASATAKWRPRLRPWW